MMTSRLYALVALLALSFSTVSGAKQACGTLDLEARATQHCFPDDGGCTEGVASRHLGRVLQPS